MKKFSVGDLVFKNDGSGDLFRVTRVLPDFLSNNRYEVRLCCRFLDTSNPDSIRFYSEDYIEKVPEHKLLEPEKVFINSYLNSLGIDSRYSIKGGLV